MSNLIRRQDAIDAVKGRFSMPVDNLIVEVIEALPSAQPELPPYIAEIESEYRKAVDNPYIKKPLAKALYEVWKKHDRDDAERE